MFTRLILLSCFVFGSYSQTNFNCTNGNCGVNIDKLIVNQVQDDLEGKLLS